MNMYFSSEEYVTGAEERGANVENAIFGNTHLKVWVHHTSLTNVEYHFFWRDFNSTKCY